jgi:hypothetical protein
MFHYSLQLLVKENAPQIHLNRRRKDIAMVKSNIIPVF